MGVLDGKGKGQFWVNLGRPIVSSGDFVAYLCESDALFPRFEREKPDEDGRDDDEMLTVCVIVS